MCAWDLVDIYAACNARDALRPTRDAATLLLASLPRLAAPFAIFFINIKTAKNIAGLKSKVAQRHVSSTVVQGRGVCVCAVATSLQHSAAQVACATLHTAPETSPAAHLLSAFSISIAKLLLPFSLPSPPPSSPLLGTINYSPIYLFPV